MLCQMRDLERERLRHGDVTEDHHRARDLPLTIVDSGGESSMADSNQAREGGLQVRDANPQSCRTTLSSELLIRRPPLSSLRSSL